MRRPDKGLIGDDLFPTPPLLPAVIVPLTHLPTCEFHHSPRTHPLIPVFYYLIRLALIFSSIPFLFPSICVHPSVLFVLQYPSHIIPLLPPLTFPPHC